MVAVAGITRMPRGRPKSDKLNRTELVRVRDDLEKMIRWVCKVEGVSSAEMLDDILRPAILERYAHHLPVILSLKASADARREEKGMEPTEALPEVVVVEPKDIPADPKAAGKRKK